MRRAITYELNEQIKLAKADFRFVLEAKAENCEDYRAKGIAACYIHRNISNYYEALKHFDRALDLKPNDCQSLLEKGFVLEVLNLKKKAVLNYSKIL